MLINAFTYKFNVHVYSTYLYIHANKFLHQIHLNSGFFWGYFEILLGLGKNITYHSVNCVTWSLPNVNCCVSTLLHLTAQITVLSKEKREPTLNS